MTEYNQTLKELIQIANDGADFYRDAAEEVSNPKVVELFRRMGSHKRVLGAALATKLEASGEQAPESGTVAGVLRKAYTDLRAALSSQEEAIYISQLEETEDRLLEHFEQALAETKDVALRSTLQIHMPKVRACHDEMRNWKRSVKNAA